MTEDLDLFGEVAAPPRAVRFSQRVHFPATARAMAEAMRRQGASLKAISGALGAPLETVRARLSAELERGLPGGRPSGRPRWSPTAGDRATVAQLAAEGVAQDQIAQVLGTTSPTLRRHCAAELADGRARRRQGVSVAALADLVE